MSQTISASVGANGANRASDIATIQTLLNRVPQDQGGPNPKLNVDGIIGPKTQAAITNFQKRQFGKADGLVEPGKATIQRLNALVPDLEVGGMCGVQEIDGPTVDRPINRSRSVKVGSTGGGGGGSKAKVGGGSGGAGDTSGVAAAKAKLPEAREWVRAAIAALDRIITFDGKRADVANLAEFKAAKTHFHVDLSMTLSQLQKTLNKVIPLISPFEDPVVDICKVARLTFFDILRNLGDPVVAKAYIPFSQDDLDDSELGGKAAFVPEPRDGTIHFSAFFTQLGPMASVLTQIHETVHFLGPGFGEVAYRDRRFPDGKGGITVDQPRKYLDLPAQFALINPDSYAYFALQVKKGVDRIVEVDE